MIVESRSTEFLRSVERAFSRGLEDAADVADKLPGSPSDLRAQQLEPFRGRIGSTRPYAKAQEKGAYIRPRRGRSTRSGRPPAVKYHDGRIRRWGRLPAQRYLEKTGKRWGRILGAALRRG